MRIFYNILAVIFCAVVFSLKPAHSQLRGYDDVPIPPTLSKKATLVNRNHLPTCSDDEQIVKWHLCWGKAKLTNKNNVGDTYEGEWRNGLPDGFGSWNFSDGRIYVGDFVEGASNGYGTLTLPNGAKFTGQFLDGNYVDKNQEKSSNRPIRGGESVSSALNDLADSLQDLSDSLNGKKDKNNFREENRKSSQQSSIPDGLWKCASGSSSAFRTYYDMNVRGNTYTLQGAGNTFKGDWRPSNNWTRYGGSPVSFPTGGWHGFVGEYQPKGTPDINGIPTIEHKIWLRPEDASSYSVTCSMP